MLGKYPHLRFGSLVILYRIDLIILLIKCVHAGFPEPFDILTLPLPFPRCEHGGKQTQLRSCILLCLSVRGIKCKDCVHGIQTLVKKIHGVIVFEEINKT